MPKIWDKIELPKTTLRLNEDEWFVWHQPFLLWYANTHEGYIETIKGFKVPCTEIILCDFGDDDSLIPEMKLAECKRLMIDMFYDDRPSTIELLHQNSIAAFLVPKPIKS